MDGSMQSEVKSAYHKIYQKFKLKVDKNRGCGQYKLLIKKQVQVFDDKLKWLFRCDSVEGFSNSFAEFLVHIGNIVKSMQQQGTLFVYCYFCFLQCCMDSDGRSIIRFDLSHQEQRKRCIFGIKLDIMGLMSFGIKTIWYWRYQTCGITFRLRFRFCCGWSRRTKTQNVLPAPNTSKARDTADSETHSQWQMTLFIFFYPSEHFCLK